MAAPVPLLPLDSSLPSSVLSSGSEEVSSARQRRRRTTKKPEIEKLAASALTTLGSGAVRGLELNTFESHGHSSRDLSGISKNEQLSRKTVNGSYHMLEDSAHGRNFLPSLEKSELNGRARKKRSHHREKRHKEKAASASSPTPPWTRPQEQESGLDDSTTQVASLLRDKLRVAEESGKTEEVIVNEGARLSPRFESGAGQHSSGVVTEEEDSHAPSPRHPEGAGHTPPLQRPLPPPAISTDHSELAGAEQAVPDPEAAPDPDEPPSDVTDILGITIHGTDELQASVFLTHPSVRVSFFDTSIQDHLGVLLKKSAPEKCVTSYYERGNPSVDYILPVLTQPFECRHHRAVKGTLTAQWEETLTFNERPSYFTRNDQVVIFFELLDFVSTGSVGVSSRERSQHRPWHRIAWAFLRPAGKTCKSRMGKRIRLQLYRYPKKMFGHSTEGTEAYDLWRRHYRTTYPSTLYVTLSRISMALPQETVPEPSTRSFDPLQEEKGSLSFEQMMKIQMASKSFSALNGIPSATLVSATQRLPGQPCQVPLSRLSTQYPTPMGCSSLTFSHAGHLLAAGCADQPPLYPLVIYEVPGFKPVLVTEGHRGIIYQVCWSPDDSTLVSASADGIVKVWSLEGGSSQARASLPHPCYVYCVCFLTGQQWADRTVLATGAYDGYVRIWSLDDKTSVQLIGEFHGHSGHVNCLVWSEKASRLYAGDSKGMMGVWHRKKDVWMLKRKVDVMNGQPLISMKLHPNSRKMLLHTQKAKLAMLDLRIDHICCNYDGIEPSGLERCGSFLSPCGGLVFAGTPRGTVYVWSADSGKELHVYSDLAFAGAVGAMSYHPSQHMLALSSFGTCQPLVILNHTSKGPSATLATPKVTLKASSVLAEGEETALWRVPLERGLRGEGDKWDKGVGGGTSPSERGSSVSLAVSDTQQSLQSLKTSRKLTDLVKTLDRVTTRTKL